MNGNGDANNVLNINATLSNNRFGLSMVAEDHVNDKYPNNTKNDNQY